MSAIPISELEAALLSALEDLRVSRGGPLRTLRGFAAPWRSAHGSTALALPAVLVRYAGWRGPTPGAGQLGGWSRWIATVIAGAGATEATRRGGTGATFSSDPRGAAWALLEALRERLALRPPVPGCGPLVCRAESPAEPDAGFSVWEQTWEFSLPGAGFLPPLAAIAGAGPSSATPYVAADDLEIVPLSGAEAFHQGDPLFLADSDAANNRYLGHVVAIVEGAIRFERSPAVEYAGNSILWSPASWFEWSTGRCPAIRDSWDSGAEWLGVGQGAGLSMRLRGGRRSTRVGFGPVALEEVRGFRAWLESAARGGADAFTWVDERGSVARARIQSPAWREEEREEGLASVEFDLALDAPGSRAL